MTIRQQRTCFQHIIDTFQIFDVKIGSIFFLLSVSCISLMLLTYFISANEEENRSSRILRRIHNEELIWIDAVHYKSTSKQEIQISEIDTQTNKSENSTSGSSLSIENTENKNKKEEKKKKKLSLTCHYMGWLHHQNIGDDAIYEVFQLTNNEFASSVEVKILEGLMPANEWFKLIAKDPEIILCFVMGGGSLYAYDGYLQSLRWYLSFNQKQKAKKKETHQLLLTSFGTGFDELPSHQGINFNDVMIDKALPAYSSMFNDFKRIQSPVPQIKRDLNITLLSSLCSLMQNSFSNKDSNAIRTCKIGWETDPRISRGMITQFMMDCSLLLAKNANIEESKNRLLFNGNPSQLDLGLGDAGLLAFKTVDSKFDIKQHRDWLKMILEKHQMTFNDNEDEENNNEKNDKRVRICINFGISADGPRDGWEYYRKKAKSNENLQEVFLNSIIDFNRYLKKEKPGIGLDLILWSIFPPDTAKFINKLASRLRQTFSSSLITNQTRVINVGFLKTTANVIRLHRVCDLSMTYKLHAMILSHSALCPGVHFAYRVKVIDHIQLLGLEKYALKNHQVTSDEASQTMIQVYQNKLQIRKQLKYMRKLVDQNYQLWWQRFEERAGQLLTK